MRIAAPSGTLYQLGAWNAQFGLNPHRNALGHAFGAASEAGRMPAGASGHPAHAARRNPAAGQQFRSACRPRWHLRLTAHSGRNSGEFRRPVRGSECVSQRPRARFHYQLWAWNAQFELNPYRSALGHAFRAASGAGRRPAGTSGHAAHTARRSPGVGQQFRSACRTRRASRQPLTLAVVLTNAGALFAMPNPRQPATEGTAGVKPRAGDLAKEKTGRMPGPGIRPNQDRVC